MLESNIITANHQNANDSPVFNPFPGLRPFSIDESHLFFGREGQSEEVLKLLSENRFVAVVGASGSGKSSLMYCGLVPILYGGFITEAGSRWRIITFRPGNKPIDNLSEAIYNSELIDTSNEEEKFLTKNFYSTVIKSSSLGLTEAIKFLKKPAYENVLLMVDQFEELFRFKRNNLSEDAENESESFIKLLVNAVRQSEVPIYIIITMRSDFIGDCSQFQELTQLMNESNYLIPQMTRDDFREAVTGPVSVGKGRIDSNLVQQLLNDISDNPDQLPILQHALMRTWDYWTGHKRDAQPLSIEDYESVGKMESALSEHANEAFDELNQQQRQICESMFKSLTERGADNRGVRRPSTVREIASIAKCDPAEVIEVADIFRKTGRSFLTPSYENPLDENSVLDISHESLMRIWDRLKSWVEEEAASVQMYLRLSEAAELYQQGKTGLYRQPDLQLALNWKEKQKPTLEWAMRYNPAFERTMVYLKTSEQEYLEEEENKIKQQKRALRRSRMFAIVLGTAAIISLGLMFWAQDQSQKAQAAQIEAEEQREIAEQQQNLAQQAAQQAQDSAEVAQQQRAIALTQQQLAEQRRVQAEDASEEARLSAQRAEDSARVAQLQRQEAERQQQIALEQQREAEQARAEALKLRMQSIAQSMAVKATQIDNDPDLQSLLAYQAYLFNIENEGLEFNPDIYSGLYYSLQSKKGAQHNQLSGHAGSIRSINLYDDDSYLITTAGDRNINRWPLYDSLGKHTTIYQLNRVITTADMSYDNQYIACVTSGPGIYVIDMLQNEIQPSIIQNDQGRIINMKFEPQSNNLFTVSADGSIFQHNIENSTSLNLTTVEGETAALDISKNGSLYALGLLNGKIVVGNLPTGEYEVIDSISSPVSAIAISQDSKLLAAGDRVGNITIYDLNTKTSFINFNAHEARISNLVFNTDGTILASGSFDSNIKLWDRNNFNNQPIVLSDHESWILSIKFKNNGENLFSGDQDGNIFVWNTQIEDMANELRGLINRNFTEEEWRTYVAEDIPYEKTLDNI